MTLSLVGPRLAAGAFLLSLLAACGPASTNPPTGIGPDGGTVNGPNGSQAVIPPGALMSFVDIAIASPGSEPPPFPPANIIAVGDVYEFTPHGQTFAKPVLVRIPFNPSLVPAGETPRLYRAQPGETYGWLADAVVTGNFLEVTVDSFSYLAPGVPVAPPAQTYELGQRQPTHLAPYPGGGVVVTGLAQAEAFVSLVAPNGTVTWTSTTRGERTLLTSEPRVAVGPTGNVYVATATGSDEAGVSLGGRTDVRVTSFNPQGAQRPGWPQRVRLNFHNLPAGLVVDGQDNVYVYGTTAPQDALQHDSYRPWLASWTEAAVVRTAPAVVDFGGTASSRRILAADIALKAGGGLYLTARIAGMSVVIDPGTGVHLHSFDAAGAAVDGFPLRLSMDTPTHGASLAVGQDDSAYVLGKELYGVTKLGAGMMGFPKSLPSLAQGNFTLSTAYQPILTATPGGLYVPGEVAEHIGSKGGMDVAVQGLTLDGSQRALFPRFTGTSTDDNVINAVRDVSNDSLWLLWMTGSGTPTAQLSRFPAN